MPLARHIPFILSFLEYAGRKFYVAVALALGGAVLEGMGILLLIPMARIMLDANGAGVGSPGSMVRFMSSIGIVTPGAQIVTAIALFVGIVVVRAVVLWNRNIQLQGLNFGYVDHMRLVTFKALASAQWVTVSRFGHGHVGHVLNTDVSRLQSGTHNVLNALVAAILIVVQTVIAFMLSPALTSIVLGFLLLAFLVMAPLQRKAEKIGKNISVVGRQVFTVLGDFLSGLKLAKVHDGEAEFLRRYDDRLSTLRAQQLKFIAQRTTANVGFQSCAAILACGILVIAIFGFETHLVELSVILLIVTRLSGPTLTLQQGLQSLASTLPAFNGVMRLIRECGDTADPAGVVVEDNRGEVPVLESAPAVRLRAVCFDRGGSAERAEILRDVSLEIPAGSRTGLMGPSGAGKTTLADIVCGLLAPDSGVVTIDGQPLEGGVKRKWSQALAYVGQEPFLFNDTIRNNLAWANERASDLEMFDVLDQVACGDVVRNLDEGLDTVVGERAVRLSGGERQRLCLARAILRKPRMFILDEATNALDSKTERRVLEHLFAGNPTATILLVSHRASVIAKCSPVFHLEDGVIRVERRLA